MSADERFDAKWEERDCGYETPCRIWTAATFRRYDYGAFRAEDGRTVRAHVWAYRRASGPVPRGRELHHRCEMRLCVNPDHMEPLTRRAHNRLHAKAKTHCIHGHRYDAANTYINARGHRVCRTCVLRRNREDYHARKVAA